MALIRLPRWSTGYPAVDSWIDTIVSAIERAVNINVAAPLWIKQTPQGTTIGMRVPYWVIPAVTQGTVSGGTYASPTAATVSRLDWNGSALAAGEDVDCFMPFPSAAGIGTGKLVWLAWFSGAWFIIAADCSP